MEVLRKGTLIDKESKMKKIGVIAQVHTVEMSTARVGGVLKL